MSKIKILSGWSNPGGSTVAHINLTNLFNEKGHDCTFYGPHTWHLDKCKSDHLKEFSPEKKDKVLVHFMDMLTRPDVDKFVLTCHETNLFPLTMRSHSQYDFIHFVSNSQREWHGAQGPKVKAKSVIIPNVLSKLRKRSFSGRTGSYGVIGSIDPHKRTHEAIKAALHKGGLGCKVKVFGNASSKPYLLNVVKPLMDQHINVELMGHEDDKQKMYDQLDGVFHASERETFNYIKAECAMVEIPYYGVPSANSGAEFIEADGVYELWKECLEL